MLKMRSSNTQIKRAIYLAIFILLSDQISKFFIASNLNVGDSIGVLPFFNICRVANKGITFGLLSETVQPFLLIVLSLGVVSALVCWTRRNKEYILPSAMIISGAIGNIVDRVTHEAVIDFLDFHINNIHWPAFNIADSAIVIGVFVLLFTSYGDKK